MKKIALIVFFMVIPFVVCAGGNWYAGGTLHRSTVAEWNTATYANKVATAADMALVSAQVQVLVLDSRSMDTLKPFAIALVNCVDAGTSSPGNADKEVTKLAACCMVLMGW